MSWFEITVVSLLALQLFILWLILGQIGDTGRNLTWKLNVLDGSLDRTHDRQIRAQVGIEQRLDYLGWPVAQAKKAKKEASMNRSRMAL
jgi:hypothetical protein